MLEYELHIINGQLPLAHDDFIIAFFVKFWLGLLLDAW